MMEVNNIHIVAHHWLCKRKTFSHFILTKLEKAIFSCVVVFHSLNCFTLVSRLRSSSLFAFLLWLNIKIFLCVNILQMNTAMHFSYFHWYCVQLVLSNFLQRYVNVKRTQSFRVKSFILTNSTIKHNFQFYINFFVLPSVIWCNCCIPLN